MNIKGLVLSYITNNNDNVSTLRRHKGSMRLCSFLLKLNSLPSTETQPLEVLLESEN